MSGRTPLLVVDDDAPIRRLLERVARRAGFDVDAAKDGVEALEMLQRKQYEIAIIDLMMPRLSGYDLVQKISAMNPRPCVLVATAMASTDVAALDDSMIRGVIRKPFDIQAVANRLVETATQLAEQRALAEKGLSIAPPEVAKLPVRELVPEDEAVNRETRGDKKPVEGEPDELRPR